MHIDDFDFSLPDELIARFPLPERSASRLLCLDRFNGGIQHRRFSEIDDYLNAGDLLVFNDTRVIPARVYGAKESGGKVEILVERVISAKYLLAHVKASKSPKPGAVLNVEPDYRLCMTERRGGLFLLRLDDERSVMDMLEAVGHMPLPPYIDREDTDFDKQRYQTVYARQPGAVAAPTAGLHFDEAMLAAIKAKGVKTAFVTLHVGAGTFQPVRVENIEDHRMHQEYLEVSQQVCEQIAETKSAGGRVVAVGTTSVRSLESAAQSGEIRPIAGETQIFIYPGYKFKVVDMLLTNFHLPKSTLLMLVSAFAGRESILNAYKEAVENRYRFFSYGDAMLLHGDKAGLESVLEST